MSENELVPQDARQMLTAALSHLGNITELTVRTDDELTAANALAGQLKMCSKELVDKRQEIVKPYKDKVSAIEVEFRDVLKKLDNGISKIGQGVGAYWAQKQAAIDAENARLAAEAEARAEVATEKAISTVAPSVAAPKLEGTSMIAHYDAEVVDKAACIEALIASALGHLVTIDTATLGKMQDAAKGQMVTPGVRYTKKYRARNTGR